MSQPKIDNANGLQALYIEHLRDLYSAENQIIQALPKMVQAATDPQLKRGFEMHLKQTEQQSQRIEQIFQELGQSPAGRVCKGIYGIIAEGSALIQQKPMGAVLDAGMISVAQKVEHYEMAAYGTGRAWAEVLGRSSDAKLLQQTLDEEGEADKQLTKLALGSVDAEAAKAQQTGEAVLA